MNTLRWILGTIAVLIGGGYLILFIVSNGFRRSFGASENNPLLALIPLFAAALLLAAILFPGSKPLLHIAAVAATSLVGFCLWQLIAESATVVWFALLYLAAWFLYYWLAAWRVAPQS